MHAEVQTSRRRSRHTVHASLTTASFIVHRSSFLTRASARGSTLLLALLVLGGFIATSFTVATIVVTQLRGVRAVDQSIVASYAAESGIEDVLYRVRREGQVEGLNGTATLPNETTWTRTVTTSAEERLLFLRRDDSAQLDIFPVSGDLGADIGVRSLLIAALDRMGVPADDTTNPLLSSWLEVTWFPWLASGQWAESAGRVLRSPSDLAAETRVDLTQHPTGEEPFAYRVRLRALESDLGTVRVRAARDATGIEIVPFPSGIRATSVGQSGPIRAALQVEFPARLPLAPAFDYVLFSECDIVKGSNVACP